MSEPVDIVPNTNHYIVAAQVDARDCHNCSCHLSAPCNECVECAECNEETDQ